MVWQSPCQVPGHTHSLICSCVLPPGTTTMTYCVCRLIKIEGGRSHHGLKVDCVAGSSCSCKSVCVAGAGGSAHEQQGPKAAGNPARCSHSPLHSGKPKGVHCKDAKAQIPTHMLKGSKSLARQQSTKSTQLIMFCIFKVSLMTPQHPVS